MATAAPARSPRNGSTPPPELFEIPVDRIITGDNVRADVGDITELAASIAQHGILQPLRVEPGGDSLYLLKIGHRRLAAAKAAGLTHVPAVVDMAPALGAARSIQQLVENVQRRDLNPLEEAKALRGILDASPGMTQDELARQVGRSRPAVTNLLRLLKLPEAIQARIADGSLTAAHAKVIATLPPKQAEEIAERIAKDSLSTRDVVRDLERAQLRQQEEDQRRDRVAARDKELLAGWLALLLKKKANPATTTLVGWAGIPADGLAALAKRGWTRAQSTARGADQGWRAWQGPRPKEFCDCDAYELTYRIDWRAGDETYHAQVHPACIVKAHQAAADKAQRDAFEAQQAEQRAAARKAVEERAAALAPLTAAVTALIPPAKAKLILFALLGADRNNYYEARRWAAARGVEDLPYIGWREHLWTAIDALDHGPLLVAIAEITASAAIDAGGPVRAAIDALAVPEAGS